MKRLFGTAKETVKKVVVQASAGAVAASLFFTQPVMASVDSVNIGNQYHWGCGRYHPCKKRDGVCTGISAAGQFLDEQCH